MKKRSYIWHIAYLFCIVLIAVGSIALIMRMKTEMNTLKRRGEEIQALDREQLISSIDRAENALRMAAHCVSPSVYAAQMNAFSEGCAMAALLTEQSDPSSVWLILWRGLSDFAAREIERSVGEERVQPDGALIDSYADLLAKLSNSPEALEGPLWEDLPEGLGIPHFQTDFSLSHDQLKKNAAKLLNISEGLLKEVEIGMPGLVRYRLTNAEIDLLVSGQLVYFDLRLPQRAGRIGYEEGVQYLTDFASREGYPASEVIDLYEYDGILWAKLAPTVKVEPFGAVKNLDCPLIAACTLWNGRICHFEVRSDPSRLEQASDAGNDRSVKLLSEKRMKALAEERNASLGEAVICKGTLCRTLVFEEEKSGRCVSLYVDAIDGSEKETALRCTPHLSELPASVDYESDRHPFGCREDLPSYDDWQRRRYRSAALGF